MNKVISFLKAWQDVADGNTPAAREFRNKPENQKHIRSMNWAVTLVFCLGILYIFTQPF